MSESCNDDNGLCRINFICLSSIIYRYVYRSYNSYALLLQVKYRPQTSVILVIIFSYSLVIIRGLVTVLVIAN